MDENIFDKDSFDAIKPVDLKETMETPISIMRCRLLLPVHCRMSETD